MIQVRRWRLGEEATGEKVSLSLCGAGVESTGEGTGRGDGHVTSGLAGRSPSAQARDDR